MEKEESGVAPHIVQRLEIVNVRLAKYEEGQTIINILRSLLDDQVSQTCGSQTVSLLYNSKIGTDWSIHLTGAFDKSNLEKSTLGLSIADILVNKGIINHSVWKTVPIIVDQ